MNAKRVYRLYREEGLVLRRKRPKRRRSAAIPRAELCAESSERALGRWISCMTRSRGGGRMRVLAVIDVLHARVRSPSRGPRLSWR